MGLFDLARPALFTLPPEKAHELSLMALKSGAIQCTNPISDQRLTVSIDAIDFPNPLGLAAGYDKNAEVPDAILGLGFGFTEVGTITPLAQPGNPKPRVFRLVRDRGLINRLGFNNDGHKAALRRLQSRAQNGGIVGVNIGANKTSKDFVADYVRGIEAFYSLASYFTANISSPNTPGLRNLQAGEALQTLLDRIFEEVEKQAGASNKNVPIFLKIAPDLDHKEMDEIAEVVLKSKLSALIVSNTTLDRNGLTDTRTAAEAGGLSGAPLFEKSTRVLAEMYQRVDNKLPLIGVGGIGSAEDAINKIKAGASLVQLYSCMVYEGPRLPSRIVKGMRDYLDKHGHNSISEIIGVDHKKWLSK